MVRLILVTFAFLGWAFYELSGGSEFEPASAQLTNIKVDPLKPAAVQSADVAPEPNVEVTRVSLNLTSVDDVLEGRAAVPVRLPQQPREDTPVAVPAVQQGDSVALIPSLVAGVDDLSAVETVAASQGTSVGFVETRTVSGNRVNVRGGPGTNFGVIGRLVRGDRVEILEDTGTGWVRFQAVDSDTSGWIADFLLTQG